MDQDLQKQLTEINLNLQEIKKKTGTGIWRAFFNGMFSALGYIAGLALVIVVLGWILNKTGLLDSFQKQVKDFQILTEQAKKIMSVGGQQQGTTTTITLPDGQKIQVDK